MTLLSDAVLLLICPLAGLLYDYHGRAAEGVSADLASQLSSCFDPVPETQHQCACRGYFSISSQVQPNDKGHYPDTYLNIGGGKWSKGVAFINGFNLVRLSPKPPSGPVAWSCVPTLLE